MTKLEHIAFRLSGHASASALMRGDAEGVSVVFSPSGLRPGVIYVSPAADALAFLKSGAPCSGGVIFASGEDAELVSLAGRLSVALLCSALPLLELLDRVNALMEEYSRSLARFFALGAGKSDVQAALSLASSLTGAPVFLFDPSFRILRSAGVTPDAEKLALSGALAKELARLSESAESAFFSSELSGARLHILEAKSGGVRSAFIAALASPDAESDFEFILGLADGAIRNRMLLFQSRFVGGAPEFSEFWDDVAEQRLRTAPEILAHLDALPYDSGTYRRISVIDFGEEAGKLVPYDFILSRLRALFPEYNMAVYRSAIVMLMCEKDRNFSVDVDSAAINAVLEPYDGYMCLSHATRDITKLRTQYLLAKQTLPLAKKLHLPRDADTRVFHYEQYTTYLMIDMFAHRFQELHGNNDILYLGHPAIVKITRYDRQHNNNLRDVLYYYLLNDRNLVRTAEVMHMHRNTVFYKINQIKELIGMELDDGALQQDFLLSCQIIRYFEDYMGESVRM